MLRSLLSGAMRAVARVAGAHGRRDAPLSVQARHLAEKLVARERALHTSLDAGIWDTDGSPAGAKTAETARRLEQAATRGDE